MSNALIARIKNERGVRKGQSLPTGRVTIGRNQYRDMRLDVGLHQLVPLPADVFIGVDCVEFYDGVAVARVEKDDAGGANPVWDETVQAQAKGAQSGVATRPGAEEENVA